MKRGNQRKFGRDRKVRTALYKSMATALIDHGRIKTTAAKAKSLVQVVEKLITLAKRENLIIRLGQRRSDGAEMAMVELTEGVSAPVTAAK